MPKRRWRAGQRSSRPRRPTPPRCCSARRTRRRDGSAGDRLLCARLPRRGTGARAGGRCLAGDAPQPATQFRPSGADHLSRALRRAVPATAGWNGILVGDISQARGGPMLTGHASHQIGLDADIWLTPKPSRPLSRAERDEIMATNMVRKDWMDVDPAVWTRSHTSVIKLATQDPRVARIFVNRRSSRRCAARRDRTGPGCRRCGRCGVTTTISTSAWSARAAR